MYNLFFFCLKRHHYDKYLTRIRMWYFTSNGPYTLSDQN